LLVLFFLLMFVKVVNLLLDALFDHYSRTYAIYVFGVWLMGIFIAIGGLAYVAYDWYSALRTWRPDA
jgi:hypothetical protein